MVSNASRRRRRVLQQQRKRKRIRFIVLAGIIAVIVAYLSYKRYTDVVEAKLKAEKIEELKVKKVVAEGKRKGTCFIICLYGK